MIPDQLRDQHLIRVCSPDCEVHDSCGKPGKRPKSSVEATPSLDIVQQWVEQGGNYGVVADADNGLVIWDSDSEEFSNLLDNRLPDTFTVESGGEGWGEHLYFQVNGVVERQSDWSDPEGSVRVQNWHAVGPGSTHLSGGCYTVAEDRPIAHVDAEEIEAVMDVLDSRDGVQSGGGGDPRPAPSAQAVDSLDFIQRDDRRREISEILTTDSEHSRRVWAVGWLHAAAGLTANEIISIIMQEAQWPNLDRDVVDTQVRSVIDSSRSSRGTHYSKFGTADMDGNTSERRKTDTEELESSVNMEVNSTMADFNDHEEVTVLEGNEDGDSFKKVARTTREEDGETVEYVSLKKGRVELVETVDGEEVLAQRVTDSKSLGSPDYVGELAEALAELNEKVNGDD